MRSMLAAGIWGRSLRHVARLEHGDQLRRVGRARHQPVADGRVAQVGSGEVDPLLFPRVVTRSARAVRRIALIDEQSLIDPGPGDRRRSVDSRLQEDRPRPRSRRARLRLASLVAPSMALPPSPCETTTVPWLPLLAPPHPPHAITSTTPRRNQPIVPPPPRPRASTPKLGSAAQRPRSGRVFADLDSFVLTLTSRRSVRRSERGAEDERGGFGRAPSDPAR